MSKVRPPFMDAPRCHAHSKRSGMPCGQPAMNGWKVCRFHGARGGAPRGRAHGRYRHGGRTTEAIAARREIRELIRKAMELAGRL